MLQKSLSVHWDYSDFRVVLYIRSRLRTRLKYLSQHGENAESIQYMRWYEEIKPSLRRIEWVDKPSNATVPLNSSLWASENEELGLACADIFKQSMGG
jgi:hypothetical protein